MYCFTLNVGEQPSRGLQVKVATNAVGVFIGGDEGLTLPISKELFETMVRLDQQALQLPQLKDTEHLPLPLVCNADLANEAPTTTEDTEEDQDLEHPILVGRPGDEPDRRALVHVIPPKGVYVRYTGCYKREAFDGTKVSRGYPSINGIEGIEVLVECNNELILIMHPNSAFRVALPRAFNPDFYMYRLTMSKHRPNLVPMTPRSKREAA